MITHGEEELIKLRAWEDLTGDIGTISEQKITRIYITYVYDFGDTTSKETFEIKKQSQYQKNLGKDLNIDQTVEFTTNPNIDMIIIGPKDGKHPCFANGYLYFIFSILTLSWFYRMIVDCLMNDRDLKIVKKFYI